MAGPVAYRRRVFECSGCRASTAPLDAEMGVASGQKLSRGVERKVAWSVAHHSFSAAAADMVEMTGIEVSPAECQRVALEVGRRLEEEQRRRDAERLAPVGPEAPAPEPEVAAERLVLMADAACVLTVAGEEHKSVLCGRAFALEDRARKQKDRGAGRPFIGLSRHAADAQSWETFAPRLKALAWRMGLRRARRVAFVGDGAAPQWRWAEENLPADAALIQDFWHVVEHLAGVAREVFDENEAAMAERLERWKTLLRASGLEEILEELRAEHRRRRGAKRQRLEKEIAYLERGRARMDYARFEAEGWPIGSGAIEADCKHLVKERFDLTGARWRRANIQPVLALRTAIFNQEWETAWRRN